jgi:hypothetical protein
MYSVHALENGQARLESDPVRLAPSFLHLPRQILQLRLVFY